MSAENMAKSLRHANKAVRHDIDLGTLRATVAPTSLIDTVGLRATIIADAGAYTIVLVFGDTSTLMLQSTGLDTGDILDFEFLAMYVLNAPQPGATLSLVVDKRL